MARAKRAVRKGAAASTARAATERATERAAETATETATERASAAAVLLAPLLFQCARLFDEVAQDELNRGSGERVARPAVMRLLPHLSAEGVRPSELARRVDVSKQAIGQTLRELVTRGFVEVVPDPRDGRAQLVRLTAASTQAFARGNAVLGFYEQQLRLRLGDALVDDAARALAAMQPVLLGWRSGEAPRRRVSAPAATKRRHPRR